MHNEPQLLHLLEITQRNQIEDHQVNWTCQYLRCHKILYHLFSNSTLHTVFDPVETHYRFLDDADEYLDLENAPITLSLESLMVELTEWGRLYW